MSVEFVPVNLAQFKAEMHKRAERLSRDLETISRKTASDIKRQAMMNTPVRTGDLRRGWQGPIPIGKWAWEVRDDVEYAIYVERGTWKMNGRHMLGNAVHLYEPMMRKKVKEALRRACA